ncbi:hypothetical protein QQX09_06195 [Demequina sp. SYSU T00192]|uniref:Uncharacterized protein n=1 Tax=Demequina litoralis TaxID=3051660 RepID=A0ABT8G8H3_9MICO|nr:hypothetical protein [Demequina sp. SYSU T00192]MDN4475442.1 hypothetical protein [Demequina sp. SYSU T00192]
MTLENSATTSGSLSRRRIIQGAAWVTPAILIATASPPAAASVTDVPEVTLDLVASKAANDGVSAKVAVAIGAGPAMSYLETGFTVTVAVPRGSATLISATAPTGDWILPRVPGKNAKLVNVVYSGPRMNAGSGASTSFTLVWQSALSNGKRKVSAALLGNSGAGTGTVSLAAEKTMPARV